jgi:ribosome-associated protein
MEFQLTSEYIELLGLLKVTGHAMTGGEAKFMVDDGLVKLNGTTEFRRRAKIRAGDVVVVNGETITIKGE